jgi:hypothetical protein
MNREKYVNDPSYREGYDDGRKEALITYKNKIDQVKCNINNIIDSIWNDKDKEVICNDEFSAKHKEC